MVPYLPNRKRGIGFFFLLWSDRPYAKQFVCSTSFNTQKASPITILTLQIRKLRFSKVKLFAYDYNTSGGASLVTQMVKNLLAMWETQVQSLGWEDPLEKGMTTHSSILAWRITWTEEPGELQPMGSQRLLHD